MRAVAPGESGGRWAAAMPCIGGGFLGLVLIAALSGCGGDSNGAEAPDGSPEAAIVAGKRLFAKNGCQVCHGAGGRGDGKMAPALRPPPRDFRDRSAYRQGHSPAEIAHTIREGISTGRGGMPAYAHLKAEERDLIAQYIASLQVP